MKRITGIGLIVLSALAFGCGPGGSGPGGGTPAKDATGKALTDSKGNALSEPAAQKFKAGLDALAQHDKAKDWSDATCESTSQLFQDAAKEQDKPFAEAHYNAGLALHRCKKNAEAKAFFQKALEIDGKFHPAKTQLVMLSFYESGEKNIDQAISDMRQTAVVDAQYKNVEALVALAMFYMKRGNNTADNDGANDYQRAKRYLQSALAVDDGYMPAFNQLAIFYLQTAKQAAGQEVKRKTATNLGKKKKQTASQAMELADLVCSQAIRKNPNDPVIYNTMGMIQVELGNLNKAVEAFDRARQKDPSFYEAQMNFAAVNLQFRGFPKAEEAYRAVIKTRPNDYDARLGLALALRGQINDSNFDQFVKESAEHLAKAKEIAPDRPETYYNEAILTQEYKTKSSTDSAKAEPVLLLAKNLFGQFVTKAGGQAEYADAVKRAKERMGEIDQIIAFNKQTEKDRKQAEAEAKQKAAEAEASGANDEAGGTGTDAEKPQQ
jgi:tetratricopeptide (TPR) repeat protein